MMGFRTPTGTAPMFRLPMPGDGMALVVVWNGRSDYANHPPADMVEELSALGSVFIVQIGRPVGRENRSAIRASNTLTKTGAGIIIHWARNSSTFHSIVEECRSAGLMAIDRTSSYPEWRVSEPGHA